MSPANRDKNFEPPSLRKRYFSMTLLLAFCVTGVVLYFFSSTVVEKQKLNDERDNLANKQAIVDILTRNRLPIFRNIELFLLDPSSGHYDQFTHELISDSLQANNKLLLSLTSDDDRSLMSNAENLNELFARLQTDVTDLFNSRLDVNRQYPGLALAANEMTPTQNLVNSYFDIMISEIESGNLEPDSDELFILLLKSNTLWASLVSQYRIYLANRFASFSVEFLRMQALSLKEFKDKLALNIDRLEALYATEDSFEGAEGILIIKEEVSRWYQIFLAVRELHESTGWRTDNLILEKNIIPLIEGISINLDGIESTLHKQQLVIESENQRHIDTLFVLLASIVLLFLFFIAAILISLDRMVFQPISLVSNALISRAFNHDVPQIKTGNTLEISNLILAFQEMDEKINQRQEELEHQSLHDYLTSLPNRFLLHQRLDYQLLTSDRSSACFSLFFIDLNKFKDVNDTLGHAVGDSLLTQVANRLSLCVRKSDTVARLGGDEFAILLPEINKEGSEQVAKTLHESINKPFMINDRAISIGMSIGIVHYPEDGVDAMNLLQHADIAMYSAKQNRHAFYHYNSNVDIYRQHRLTLIQDLRDAIENNRLMLFYQPQFQCMDSSIYGAEALIRWNHPEFGFIQPEKIIELAEYGGVIHQLTLWVLKHAIAECSYWHDKDFPANISVNISIQDFNNDQLCEQIGSLLQQYSLNPYFLTLEITENGMMDNPGLSIQILHKLKQMGIKLSVDDFGTGFSSLTYLKKFPVDELKIDKSFVMDMLNDENDKIIVKSTINLGHNLGLKVVAEGVEHKDSLKLINSYGCDSAQGYLFAKPLSGQKFLNYLKNIKPLLDKIK